MDFPQTWNITELFGNKDGQQTHKKDKHPQVSSPEMSDRCFAVLNILLFQCLSTQKTAQWFHKGYCMPRGEACTVVIAVLIILVLYRHNRGGNEEVLAAHTREWRDAVSKRLLIDLRKTSSKVIMQEVLTKSGTGDLGNRGRFMLQWSIEHLPQHII